MLQALAVHYGSQVSRSVLAHQADTLYVQTQPFRDDSDIDSFSALVDTCFPDPVDLPGLKTVYTDCFIKAGIQTNGGNHTASPILVYSDYYTIPYVYSQLTFDLPDLSVSPFLFIAVCSFFW